MDVKEMASLGGKARWEKKTEAEKKAHAEVMVLARRIKKFVGEYRAQGYPEELLVPMAKKTISFLKVKGVDNSLAQS